MTTIYRAAGVHDGERLHPRSEMIIDGGVVQEIRSWQDAPSDAYVEEVTDQWLLPGLVDIQVNGGGGVLLNRDPSPSTINQMAEAHQRLGVTAVVPTLITDHPRSRSMAYEAHAEAMASIGDRRLPALHLEGPHIARSKRGVHPLEYIADLDKESLAELLELASEIPLVVTLAPDVVRPGIVEELVAAGAIVSLGHTDCTFEQACRAFAAGATLVTHLFNAMSDMRAREPGMVGAALDRAPYCGLIYDRSHVSAPAARVAARSLGERLVLVSDCLSPPGGGPSSFLFGGVELTVQGSACLTQDGSLGGSALSLMDCLRAAVEDDILPFEDAVTASTSTPAAAIGRRDLGRLVSGGRADFLVVSKCLELGAVFVDGQMLTLGRPTPSNN